MGHLVRMHREPPKIPEEELGGMVNQVIEVLSSYLEGYVPKRPANTKHSIMGPVGKLLSAMEANRFSTVDGYVGYTVNIHHNTGVRDPDVNQIESLKKGVSLLIEIKGKVDPSRWKRILREVDYAIYFRKLKRIVETSKKKDKGEGDGNG
ncbi:MAG: hypothetical protein J7L91_04135 [Candidatus Korarchaeota archaeon]|nr:hypothetical protein [Candidatus Korarchaeota archaeon]